MVPSPAQDKRRSKQTSSRSRTPLTAAFTRRRNTKAIHPAETAMMTLTASLDPLEFLPGNGNLGVVVIPALLPQRVSEPLHLVEGRRAIWKLKAKHDCFTCFPMIAPHRGQRLLHPGVNGLPFARRKIHEKPHANPGKRTQLADEWLHSISIFLCKMRMR